MLILVKQSSSHHLSVEKTRRLLWGLRPRWDAAVRWQGLEG